MWGLQGEPLQKLLRIIMLCNKNTCKAFYGIYIMLYVKNNCGFKFLIIQTSQNNTKQQQQKITQINWKWFTNFYLSNLTKPTFIISCQNFLTYVSWTVMTKLSIVLYLWLWYLLCTYCSRMYCNNKNWIIVWTRATVISASTSSPSVRIAVTRILIPYR